MVLLKNQFNSNVGLPGLWRNVKCTHTSADLYIFKYCKDLYYIDT